MGVRTQGLPTQSPLTSVASGAVHDLGSMEKQGCLQCLPV